MYSTIPASRFAVLATFSVLLEASSLLVAQSPIGTARPVSTENRDFRGFQVQTVLANGEVLVAWLESPTFEEPDPVAIRARRFRPGRAAGEVVTLVDGRISLDEVFAPLLARRMDSGFLMTFGRVGRETDSARHGCRARAFDGEAVPFGAEVAVTTTGACVEGLVGLEDGTFGTVLFERQGIGRNGREYRWFERLSSEGERVSDPRRLNPNPRRIDETVGRLAGNSRGEMTYVWDGLFSGQVRSFNAYGGPLPPLGQVRFTSSNRPAVAVTPAGVRIFAGFNFHPPDSNFPAFQIVSAEGTPLTRVRPAIPARDALFGDPVLAADRFGNFVLAWASLPGIFDDRTEARLFRADGTPVGPAFFPEVQGLAGFRPQVSFGDDGTFALTWVDDQDLKIAFFSASPGDEPCLVRRGHLLCDTGRTGGEPENDQPDAPSGTEPVFLADYDGDGRADPCFRSGTTFRCDLEHRGAGPRARVRFGEAGDTPLMGDVDGDGRAEACVRRGDLLSCDTAHDGGGGESEERFGDPAATPLLGDLDGDHRDDLCLYRAGAFTCDLRHDGGAPERSIAFGQAGDLPVLGDFDGDGRDDPCVLRGSTLLCDTRHDGGDAEGRLALSLQPGDGIVLGNLDGL